MSKKQLYSSGPHTYSSVDPGTLADISVRKWFILSEYLVLHNLSSAWTIIACMAHKRLKSTGAVTRRWRYVKISLVPIIPTL